MQGLGNFRSEWYWSSTPFSFTGAWNSYQAQNFGSGERNWRMAADEQLVRPIRQF